MAVKTAFDTVEMLSAVIVEDENTAACSGREFARLVSNRTLHLTTDGNSFVDTGRTRNLNINIFAFNVSLRSMQVSQQGNKYV